MWNPSPLTRDQTHTPCTGRLGQCWTAREDSAVSYKVKGTITIEASDPIPRCLLQRNEDVHPYGDSYNSAHSSFICNIPQLEAAHVCIHRYMG